VLTEQELCGFRGQFNAALDAIQCPPPKDEPDANPA
jgi:hypothetical protein